jgi:hypothetical protein
LACSAEWNQQLRAAHTFAMATHNFEAMAAKLEDPSSGMAPMAKRKRRDDKALQLQEE